MSETNRLRTPAQVVDTLHTAFDSRDRHIYFQHNPADAAAIQSQFLHDTQGLPESGAERERLWNEGRRRAEIAYLQWVDIDRWTRTEDALPPSEGHYLVMFAPKFERFNDTARHGVWRPDPQYGYPDKHAAWFIEGGRFAPHDIFAYRLMPSLPAAALSHATPRI